MGIGDSFGTSALHIAIAAVALGAMGLVGTLPGVAHGAPTTSQAPDGADSSVLAVPRSPVPRTTASRMAAARDPAAAVARFQDALRSLDDGELDAACDQFEASWLADPTAPSAINLAECRAQQGRLATAWAWYVRTEPLAAREKRPDLRDEARQRAAELRPKLSFLTIHVADRVPGLAIQYDDVTVGPAGWDAPTPVDPGRHVISATADGYRPYRREITVGAQAAESVEVPALEPALEPGLTHSASPTSLLAPEFPSADPGLATAPAPAPASSSPPVSSRSPARTWPLVLGGIGTTMLVAGTISSLLAVGANADMEHNCSAGQGCSPEGWEAKARRDLHVTVANITVPVGVAALGGATAWWLLTRTSPEQSGREASAALAAGAAVLRHGGGVLWVNGRF